MKLNWQIVKSPGELHLGGCTAIRYWAEAYCDCGNRLSATGDNKQRLEADELRVVNIHFRYDHDHKLQQKLRRGIQEGDALPLDCQCCGFHGLRNPHVVEGHIVGPECKEHSERFPCRRPRVVTDPAPPTTCDMMQRRDEI